MKLGLYNNIDVINSLYQPKKKSPTSLLEILIFGWKRMKLNENKFILKQ